MWLRTYVCAYMSVRDCVYHNLYPTRRQKQKRPWYKLRAFAGICQVEPKRAFHCLSLESTSVLENFTYINQLSKHLRPSLGLCLFSRTKLKISTSQFLFSLFLCFPFSLSFFSPKNSSLRQWDPPSFDGVHLFYTSWSETKISFLVN